MTKLSSSWRLREATYRSNVDHVSQDIHDILHSYYNVARKRFVDNVCMQAMGYELINGPDTPLKLFSPSFITNLTDEQLEDIAGEDHGLKRKRAQLEKEITSLGEGKKTLSEVAASRSSNK